MVPALTRPAVLAVLGRVLRRKLYSHVEPIKLAILYRQVGTLSRAVTTNTPLKEALCAAQAKNLLLLWPIYNSDASRRQATNIKHCVTYCDDVWSLVTIIRRSHRLQWFREISPIHITVELCLAYELAFDHISQVHTSPVLQTWVRWFAYNKKDKLISTDANYIGLYTGSTSSRGIQWRPVNVKNGA